MYHNIYECSECGSRWENDDESSCNDRCPDCNAETEPSESIELVDG